jgi:hypothetical protein
MTICRQPEPGLAGWLLGWIYGANYGVGPREKYVQVKVPIDGEVAREASATARS